uniref:VWFA domain-containing protein n=1 Tax=Scophthalmus maximus TaxID=52904 RepID=A0A8D2ZH04_SCOMX
DSRNGFEEIRGLVEKIVESLNLGENRDQVAVVQYSRDATVNFYLNSYSSKNDVLSSIRTMRHKYGRPLNIGKALAFVRDNVFSSSVGGRSAESVPQYLYIFSGGRSGDDVREPAQSLKENGIKTFSIGTKNADTLEMQTISFTPAHYFHVTNFNNLQSIHPSVESADIVFLLDGSDEMQESERLILDFVREFVNQLEIGPSKVQVALIQYSAEPTADFRLNTYSLKENVMSHLSNVKLKGGFTLNTGVALDYVKNNVLTTSSGSRAQQGVPQILIILRGRKSEDDVLGPVDRLRKAGIALFSVGVNNTDTLEMEQLAHSLRAEYLIKEKSDFPFVKEQLLSAIASHKDTVSPGVGDMARDIVFLIDGSDDVRSKFSAIREFVAKMVDSFDLDQGKDKVAVVQYSNNAELSFNLNTYNTRDDALKHVTSLKPKGGRPQYIGAALQFVRDNVFVSTAGGRHHEGAKQILVVLAGGRSRDSPRGPASMLKAAGVVTFAVGSRMSNSAEMQVISSDPNYTYSIPDFNLDYFNNLDKHLWLNCPRGRDVVFLLDGSDGTRAGFPAMRDFVQRVVETLSVDDNKDRVSVVQYSRDPTVQFYLNTYTTKGEILDTLRDLRHKGGRPLNTGAALQYLRDNVFTVSAGSRRPEGVQQVLILLSGGRSFDSVDAPASALKKLGVLTFAIGTRSSDSRELQNIAHDPSYALSVSEFTDLPSVQQQLQDSVEAAVIDVTPESPTVLGIAKKDIVFLLDGSDGTRNGFPAMRNFVERVVEKLNVGENEDRVSVVQYSRDAEVHFYLKTYTTREEIVDSVRGLRHRGGRPLNTGAALQYVRDNVFTNSSGSRRLQGVPQMLILLNGGRSFDNVDTPASALKQQGIFVIGIGTRSSDIKEMQKISYDPSLALAVSEFTDLPSIQEQLSSVMSTGRDVVFLLDGSDGTRAGFPAMRDFVQRVVETLSVDDNKDRVSVVQYSRDPTVQFYLNTYTTKGEILDTLRDLRHKGGRPLNTGAALQYLRDNVFTVSAGSRRPEGVQQVLILLSGGRSFDSVDAAASALKKLGVLTFAIGTRSSDSRELQNIAHDPSYALSVSEFTDLPSVQQQLQDSVEAAVIDVTPESPTVLVDSAKKDIVFLLDGSDGTRNGFPAMRNFVERVVEKLNVGENKDRVSVVQYSRDAEVHFYLKTYTTREEIVDSVRALQYVRDNVFTNSSGSRRLQGVPQMLILLNGGRSFDNVDTPASALKQQGIFVIGIGTRSSDIKEMQKISYDPSLALAVSEFTDLPSIQEQLSSVMSTVVVRATPVTPTVTGKNLTHFLHSKIMVGGKLNRAKVLFTKSMSASANLIKNTNKQSCQLW